MPALKRRFAPYLLAMVFPLALMGTSSPGWAAAILGNASGFAVLTGSSAANAGFTIITGELGVAPGTAVTGFHPPGIVTGGTIHLNDGVAMAGMTDFATAYTTLSGAAVSHNLTGGDLGVGPLGSLTAGVYKFDSTALLNGALTLDGGGNPDAQFVFIIGSALTTASNASVILANGTFYDNVFWVTGTAATLGSATAFAGSILAGTSITLGDGARIVCGRALAEVSVTMISNQISTACQQGTGDGQGVPAPGSIFLLCLGVLGLSGMTKGLRRARKTRADASDDRHGQA